MAWLPATSVVVEPARSDMARWAGGGIIRSSVVTRYQLGVVRQAGSVIAPPRAFTPQGTCESAMNAASSAGRSPANEGGKFSRSKNRKPSLGGRIGGPGTSDGKPAMSVLTDSPASGANATMYTTAATFLAQHRRRQTIEQSEARMLGR